MYIMKIINQHRGFSLIELLIAVAIVGILAGVAYPSYIDFVIRSDRSEAQRELLRLANIQEQVFVDNRAYAGDMTGLGNSASTYETASTNYVISVSEHTDTTFTLQADAKNNQLKDSGCTELTVDHLGTKSPTECWEK